MSNQAEAGATPADISQDDLQTLFAKQRNAFREFGTPDAEQRRAALQRLHDMLLTHADELADAVNADFGQRSAFETRVLELFPVVQSIKHARRHVAHWMKAKRRSTSLWFWPARARVIFQPLGVVGIVVPWNYPIYLALGPLTSALSAGNRALIKMSEFTPHTGEVLQRLVAQIFPEDEVAVINGDIHIAQAFTRLPFDHLLFTGSTAVGSKVMAAASDNLTPVTLELGGKSPALLGPDADIGRAAKRIMVGKLLNAGQTCVAPDYVLLPQDRDRVFIERARRAVRHLYPKFENNPDYASIIDERQYQRLQDCIKDAIEKGAEIIELVTCPDEGLAAKRKLKPLAITNIQPDMRVAKEELFGPLLPIITYRSLDQALTYINERPRPLALYYFGKNRSLINKVVCETHSGGVTINDTMLHIAQDDLPFGGVGASGMGCYHGRDGFETFSQKKGVLFQRRVNTTFLLYPPFGKRAAAIIKWMLGRRRDDVTKHFNKH